VPFDQAHDPMASGFAAIAVSGVAPNGSDTFVKRKRDRQLAVPFKVIKMTSGESKTRLLILPAVGHEANTDKAENQQQIYASDVSIPHLTDMAGALSSRFDNRQPRGTRISVSAL
jgi:hypothetical protein